MFKKKKYRKAVAYGSIFIAGTQLTGYLYIINYATSIFKASSSDPADRTPQIFTIILGCVSLAASLISGPIIQRFGRKIIILIGQISVAASHFVFMGISLNDPNSEALKYMVILVLFFYVVTLAAVKWVYLGDILKGPGLSIANFVNFTTAFLVTLISPIISESVGSSETFAIFGISCTAGFFFALFFLKETKGLGYFETLNIFNKDWRLKRKESLSPTKKKLSFKVSPLEKEEESPKKSSEINVNPIEEDSISSDPESLNEVNATLKSKKDINQQKSSSANPDSETADNRDLPLVNIQKETE